MPLPVDDGSKTRAGKEKAQESELADIKSLLITVVSRLDKIDKSIKNSTVRIAAVESKVEAAGVKLVAVEGELAELKANYSELIKRINQLEKENSFRSEENLRLRISINELYQQRRMFTVHFLNVLVEIKDADEAAKMLYDRYILPSYLKYGVTEYPDLYNVIEFAHILPPNPDAKIKFPGHKYICKFTTRFYMLRFFLQKKRILEAFNKENKTIVKAVHDYTHQNRVVLDMLHNEELLKKVTVWGTRLMFKMSVEGAWKTVVNPFAAIIADLTVLPASKDINTA